MPPRSSRSAVSVDVLGSTAVVLETMQQASTAVSAVPFLGAIIGSTLSLVQAAQKVKTDRERALRLAKRAADLVKHIEETIAVDPDASDERLKTNLAELLQTLKRISFDVEKQTTKKFWSRLLHQSSVSGMLDGHTDSLDAAWRSFDTICLIVLQQKLERQLQLTREQNQTVQEQAMYDRDQYRLFRLDDVNLQAVRGIWVKGDITMGDEYQGEWQGRAVVVRRLRGAATNENPAAMVTRYPRLFHPHIAQVFGYSHPAVADRFYVMETGTISIASYVKDKDFLEKLRHPLRMIVDYADTFFYIRDSLLKKEDTFSHCGHDKCMTSITLRNNGKLVLAVEDVANSRFDCMYGHMAKLSSSEGASTCIASALTVGRHATDERFVCQTSETRRAGRPCAIRCTGY
ncbi:hypothetical protein OBBRIDRAFT_80989 [Obba rivulosa]|uniref:Mixed lineage kinase domain-containing protein n=1 Tax=Obba rivulosa TaxID=1052685 RepID=A0A8E2DHT8_9APHY|nr:hypothetical protein OBBRIDRAFT_80989 [Obba rivulosa]